MWFGAPICSAVATACRARSTSWCHASVPGRALPSMSRVCMRPVWCQNDDPMASDRACTSWASALARGVSGSLAPATSGTRGSWARPSRSSSLNASADRSSRVDRVEANMGSVRAADGHDRAEGMVGGRRQREHGLGPRPHLDRHAGGRPVEECGDEPAAGVAGVPAARQVHRARGCGASSRKNGAVPANSSAEHTPRWARSVQSTMWSRKRQRTASASPRCSSW